MPRVRFAPSPTGYLHIGSARTFIFNWLYARHNQGTMILRIDDTDVERNTDISLNSIFDGLKWLGLSWDEQYRQSDRIELHQRLAWQIFAAGHAYRDFTPAHQGDDDREGPGTWLFNTDAREMSAEESQRRADAGEPFVLRFRVPRHEARYIKFPDAVYATQSKSVNDIEDFALLRSNGMPTYHMASCADDIDLKISHIIRGQDHLSNTFKHILIFEALGAPVPVFAHLPLLVAPDGAKLSKRKHGPVVSVMTYEAAGFLPHAYINFLCLLGWSPKNNREQMSRQELIDVFSFEGINRSNAVVNFSEADPIDPKATWLNSQHLRSMPLEELTPLVRERILAAGLPIPYSDEELPVVVDILRLRMSTLNDFAILCRSFFTDDWEMNPAALEKLNAAGAREGLRELGARLEATTDFSEAGIEAELRKIAEERGLKAGILINGSRAALTGQPVGPSAFHVFTALGRKKSIERLLAV
ncbi:MAG: glutamate--tRNA ligase [Acidobacteria bacterium]|nr:glutamate--tRNA ligase [Acidobacteriota bacterium]